VGRWLTGGVELRPGLVEVVEETADDGERGVGGGSRAAGAEEAGGGGRGGGGKAGAPRARGGGLGRWRWRRSRGAGLGGRPAQRRQVSAAIYAHAEICMAAAVSARPRRSRLPDLLSLAEEARRRHAVRQRHTQRVKRGRQVHAASARRCEEI
jgi:hypothetical protein